MEEESGAKKSVFDPLTHAWTFSPNVDGWCTEAVLQSCGFFSLSKLLYITFLANLEHSVLSLGSIFKWINPPWGWKMLLKRCRRSPISSGFINVKHVWTYMRSFKTIKKMIVTHLNANKHITWLAGCSMLLHATTWKFSSKRCKYDTSKWQKMASKVWVVCPFSKFQGLLYN